MSQNVLMRMMVYAVSAMIALCGVMSAVHITQMMIPAQTISKYMYIVLREPS